MRFTALILLMTFAVSTVRAQQCNCLKTFDSLSSYLEKNYAGSKDKLNPQTRKAYQAHLKKYRAIAQQAPKDAWCYYAIDKYLEFFRDHHVYIVTPDYSVKERMDKAIASVEKLQTDSNSIRNLYALKDKNAIEGIYFNDNYKVALLPSKKGIRSYAAIILESKAEEWKRGMVKFELIPRSKNDFDAIFYYKNHAPVFSSLQFANSENGLVKEGWKKIGLQAEPPALPQPLFEEELNFPVYFKQLDSNTTYLRIKSFDLSQARSIDSVVNTNLGIITSTQNLIIDVRFNGGGADRSYKSLRPLIYTDPVKIIGVDMIVTPDNILANEALFASLPDIPKDYVEQYRKKVKEVPEGRSGFVNVFDDRTDTLTNTPAFPKKVAVIINDRCGSTTEQFLLEAVQSKKVTLYGQHSQGVLDYANVRDKAFSCPDFTLGYATTRSRRIDIGQGVDNIGIQPHVKLDLSNNAWLNEVRKQMAGPGK